MPALLPHHLPPGYRSRPATTADIELMYRLIASCEEELDGSVETDLDIVAADLARPGLDPALDTLLVFAPDGELAGRAWVNRRSEVDVHPGHRGLGLGDSLLTWVEARARESGGTRIAQTVPDRDHQGVALLRRHGYVPMVTSWLLELISPTEPVVPEPPAGITVRPFRPGDERAAHQLTEDAFDEWQQRRRSYEEWALLTVERATFAPAVSMLAFAGDQLVGAVLSLDVPESGEGYIERVAVRRDHRNQGIARVLLQHTFRGFHRQGRPVCTLWTHSNTGALSLYEKLGMTIRRSATVHYKDLTTP
ncbi:GNAT family N-acetyltransferase [Kitasatospora sp. NBC_01287]|uniref:GNAT family N-acetyltransferase n=1 Tax=Kitasatospora sp. NBC_01287 TaxID=2903573 RepID=UPI002258969E|nr:GNAT family N-acetyltransferase [Kitasatospora sp. NBC_01287]MCX4747198.1 GNAT family N-acetyltransferase [Kitasatospora sp. NBC_01287]